MRPRRNLGHAGRGGGGLPALKGGDLHPGPFTAVADTGLHVLQNVQGHVCTSGQNWPPLPKSCGAGASAPFGPLSATLENVGPILLIDCILKSADPRLLQGVSGPVLGELSDAFLLTSESRWAANLYTYIGPTGLKSSILTTLGDIPVETFKIVPKLLILSTRVHSLAQISAV